jgi:hypothetical protein
LPPIERDPVPEVPPPPSTAFPEGPCRNIIVRFCEALGEDHEMCVEVRREVHSMGDTPESREMCLGMEPQVDDLLRMLQSQPSPQ